MRLGEITLGDADNWRLWSAEKQSLSPNTIRRRCGIAKQFFRTAMRRRPLTENPFGDMKGVGVLANRQRDYFVRRGEAAKMLEVCPDSHGGCCSL